eukprot:4806748-Ditylum_brightwellii.AAC.1
MIEKQYQSIVLLMGTCYSSPLYHPELNKILLENMQDKEHGGQSAQKKVVFRSCIVGKKGGDIDPQDEERNAV